MNLLLNRSAGWVARWGGERGIGTRLKLAFGLVLLLTALLGGMAYAALATVNTAAGALVHNWLPGVGAMAAARAAILEVREFEVKHAGASDASYRSEYEEKMNAALANVGKSVTAFKALAASPEHGKLIDAFDKAWRDYLGVNRKVIELGRTEKKDDAKEVADGAGKQALDDAVGALDRLTAYGFAQGTAAGEHIGAVYGAAKIGILSFIAAALLIGTALAFGITRALIRQLGGEPRMAAQLARAVAEGDLTTLVPVKPGDSTSLMAALREMQASLARVVSTVREGSEGVATASTQIAMGNSDLSNRTEQQAMALQRTAASMSELGSTVTRNADCARQANALAVTASAVAAKGGEAVSQVVDTMKGITESSRQIADITGVIDGIAFQTNILALNAAVEAARAGEQGRGFAVVAAEVRSLAQRSAEAAKQIKTLITDSAQRVERGSQHVGRAGKTMHEVVDAIARLQEIVADISAASDAQNAGVSEVGNAVAEMDQSTQQNAALVEQSAAAADSLRQQASQLVQVVAVFRLGAAGAA